jgi:hypothetical protein
MRMEDKLRRFHEERRRVEKPEEPEPDQRREEDVPEEDAVREAQRRLSEETDESG